jgi:hypothetical protein
MDNHTPTPAAATPIRAAQPLTDIIYRTPGGYGGKLTTDSRAQTAQTQKPSISGGNYEISAA